MTEQKFKRGDLVRIAKDLGPSMTHFESDQDAIVMGSYRDQYGGDHKVNDYTIMFDNGGEVSWYHTHQLTFIKHVGEARIKEIKELKEKRQEMEADLDWIFANGEQVLKSASGSSVHALGACFGLTDLWGSNGEGFTYYTRSMQVLQLAYPFLKSGDKDGWLAFCKTIVITKQ
jgi:hypothetical protein